MLAHGDIESVNLGTGERQRRVTGNGNSVLAKEIGGVPHEKVPCLGCGELIWIPASYRGKDFCNDCRHKPNGRPREGHSDKASGVDLRYHGSGAY